MQTFSDYICQRLETNGYTFPRFSMDGKDVFIRHPDSGEIWICYLEYEITPEQIRRCFDFPGYVLFVVKESLIPQEIDSRQKTPMWLRVLHGLYMGRVYVWNDRHLFGLHFDYISGDVSESGIIQPDELLLIETGAWLRGWSGSYRIARFKDKAWWSDSSEQHDYQGQSSYPKGAYSGYANGRDNYYQKAKRDDPFANGRYEQADPNNDYGAYRGTGEQKQSSARQTYEEARDSYWKQQKERAQRTQYDAGGFAYDPNEWPNGKPPKPPPKQSPAQRDFMREFAQAGSPSAIKALFRKLAREFHPDLNPGVDTTEIMQQVNAAYERYK